MPLFHLRELVQFKPLGTTGVQVPEVGLGTWQYRGGAEPLRLGIALGASLRMTPVMSSIIFATPLRWGP